MRHEHMRSVDTAVARSAREKSTQRRACALARRTAPWRRALPFARARRPAGCRPGAPCAARRAPRAARRAPCAVRPCAVRRALGAVLRALPLCTTVGHGARRPAGRRVGARSAERVHLRGAPPPGAVPYRSHEHGAQPGAVRRAPCTPRFALRLPQPRLLCEGRLAALYC